MLIVTVSISLLTQISLIYLPFMQKIFQTASLDFLDLGVLVALAGLSMCLHEGRRRWERRAFDEGADGGRWERMEELA